MRTLYGILTIVLSLSLFTCQQEKKEKDPDAIQPEDIAHFERLSGLEFTAAERDTMLGNVQTLRDHYEKMRKHPIANGTYPAFHFDPTPEGFSIDTNDKPVNWNLPVTRRPKKDAKLALYTIPQLAYLISNQMLTSLELTQLYLKRMKSYSDTLECLVSLTEELALQQARKADEEIAAGNYRGPLHGIPYGVKDLFAVEGYKTTWGAMPFKDQEIPETAAVVQKLQKAGAVLIGKLTLGALAMGDVWYGGTTRNPWDLEQGSSGSSAGPASATAAGLVGFSLGTETYGSIVSPSTRCGVTGLRPTYGRVSRAGAMALSWTMDKAGPLCRSAKGAAMVFDAIRGKDPADPSTVDAAFSFSPVKAIEDMKIAYIRPFFEADHRGKSNDEKVLKVLEDAGARLTPVKFPENVPVESLIIILDAEAAAAFDHLTRSNRDSLLVAQHRHAWPNLFRYSRTIPATEYIQANRLRKLLVDKLNDWIQEYDAVITPSYGGNQLLATNLTGNPCVVVPNGFDDKDHPTSISFIGNLYDEGNLLRLADFYQKQTSWHQQHPEFFK